MEVFGVTAQFPSSSNYNEIDWLPRINDKTAPLLVKWKGV